MVGLWGDGGQGWMAGKEGDHAGPWEPAQGWRSSPRSQDGRLQASVSSNKKGPSRLLCSHTQLKSVICSHPPWPHSPEWGHPGQGVLSEPGPRLANCL